MDLEKLKNEVKAQSEECINLLSERERLTSEAADIVCKNIRNILRPVIEPLNEMFKAFRDAAGGCSPDYRMESLYLLKSPGQDEGSVDVYIDFSTYGVYPRVCFWKSSTYAIWSVAGSYFSDRSSEDYLNIFEWFGTEEKTQEFTDRCLEESKDIFIAWQEFFEERNAALAETVRKIKEQLSGGSTVENKEDGTVEIHLGGKTYTATLKED